MRDAISCDGPRRRRIAAQTRHQLARELIDELTTIDTKIRAADKQLRDLVASTGSSLTELNGIGPSGAARLLGDVGDIGRFRTAAHFASWNGTATIEASSGDQQRRSLPRLLDGPGRAATGRQRTRHAPRTGRAVTAQARTRLDGGKPGLGHPPRQPSRSAGQTDPQRPYRPARRVRLQGPGPRQDRRYRPGPHRRNREPSRRPATGTGDPPHPPNAPAESPRAVAADGGYGEAAVEKQLHDLGVHTVAIPARALPAPSAANTNSIQRSASSSNGAPAAKGASATAVWIHQPRPPHPPRAASRRTLRGHHQRADFL
jgi:Transposase IS116/IS110/IS902 family